MATLPDGREMGDPCALVDLMAAEFPPDELHRHVFTLRRIMSNMGTHAVEQYVKDIKRNSGQRAAVQLWKAYSGQDKP